MMDERDDTGRGHIARQHTQRQLRQEQVDNQVAPVNTRKVPVDKQVAPVNTRKVPIHEIVPEVLLRGGSISFIAAGASMWPHVRDGDFVTAVPLGANRPRTGTIIVYFSNSGALAVHRVLGVNRDGTLAVRGDAFSGRCEEVDPGSVLGRIVTVERRGQKVSLTTLARSVEGVAIARSGALRIHTEQMLRPVVAAARRRLRR